MDERVILSSSFIIFLLLNVIGFKKTLWFITLGYTFSIVIFNYLYIFLFYKNFEKFNILQNLFLTLWGIRLGSFLLEREFNKNYQEKIIEITSKTNNIKIIKKIFIWISVSLLYTFMVSPVVISTTNTAYIKNIPKQIVCYIGVIIMFIGIVIETISDIQKSIYKNKNPDKYVI